MVIDVDKIQMIVELIGLAYKISPEKTNNILKKFSIEAIKSEKDLLKFVSGLEKSLNTFIKSQDEVVNKLANEYP